MSRISVNMARVWLGPTETWPIIACLGVAIGWTTYMGTRALLANPDVNGIDRSQRESPLKDSNKLKQKGDEWYASHKKHVPKVPGEIGFFGSFPRKYQ